jgi:hypothetical protein
MEFSKLAIPFHSLYSRHIMYIDFSARNANLGSDNNAHIWSLRIEIDHTNAHVALCSQKKPDECAKKLYKNTSPMKWKYFLHWRRTFTPNDFQMHQHSLDQSYCNRETSLTKLKNSKSVMIFVVRLSSSPTKISDLIFTIRLTTFWSDPPLCLVMKSWLLYLPVNSYNDLDFTKSCWLNWLFMQDFDHEFRPVYSLIIITWGIGLPGS